jgi:hypothetical protein
MSNHVKLERRHEYGRLVDLVVIFIVELGAKTPSRSCGVSNREESYSAG